MEQAIRMKWQNYILLNTTVKNVTLNFKRKKRVNIYPFRQGIHYKTTRLSFPSLLKQNMPKKSIHPYWNEANLQNTNRTPIDV